jgi:hypothetical protein
MSKHIWKTDLSTDFDALEAELEVCDAGTESRREALAELASIYEKKLQEYLAFGDGVLGSMYRAAQDAHERDESAERGRVFASFAKDSHLAKAVTMLPRRKVWHPDFEKMPIAFKDRQQKLPPGWCRFQTGGRWIVAGSPIVIIAKRLGVPVPEEGEYMFFRAEIVDGPDSSRN